MGLAECGGAVAVQPQHLRQRRHANRALSCLPGEGGRRLRDRAHVVHVMVAAAEQRRTGRRAERRGVELVVAQSPLARRSTVGMWMGPAEGAGLAEPHIVDQHDEDVGRVGRSLHLEPRWRRGVPDVEHGAVRVRRLRDRQHRAVGGQHHPKGVGPWAITGAAVSGANTSNTTRSRAHAIDVLITDFSSVPFSHGAARSIDGTLVSSAADAPSCRRSPYRPRWARVSRGSSRAYRVSGP